MPNPLTLARALVVGALLLSGRPVKAQEASKAASSASEQRTRIVLVVSPGMDELAARFMAELASLRFDVTRAPDTDSAPSTAELEALAQAQQARAAVRVAAVGGAVDLWVVSPVTHEVVYRRVVADRDPAVAVLRSLEILRGALVDVRALAEPEAPPPPPRPSQAAPQLAPEPLTRPARAPFTAFSVAGAVLWPSAGDEVGAGAIAGVHHALGSRFLLHAAALVPIGAWTVPGEGGAARVWAGSLMVGASVMPLGQRAFTPALGLGVGALALHTRGEAQPGFRGTSDLNLSAFPHARFAATLQLGGPLSVRGEAVGGFATPRPVLLFAEARNSSWINPLLLGSIGLQIRLR